MKDIINRIKEKDAYVVFDCDNTIISGDVQNITVKYQLEYEKYNLSIDEIKSILLKQYEKFKDDIINLDMKRDFVRLSNKIYIKYRDDISFILLVGYTNKEVENLTREAIKTYPNDLTKRKEIENLFTLLRENNIDIYVCSASHVDMVYVATDMYKIPRENVMAMNLKKDKENKYLFEKVGISTVGFGKVESIKSLNKKTHPILIAGDSDGDYEMLNYFKIRHGMIINPKEDMKIKYLVDNFVYFEYEM